jgi:hypothetical protein
VVTIFLFRLHPVSMVFAGPIAFDQRHARTIMQRYREFLPGAPEELGVFLGPKAILSSPPFPRELWGKARYLLMCCYDGPEAKGKAALAPLRNVLPAPWFNLMGAMPYPAVVIHQNPGFPQSIWAHHIIRRVQPRQSWPVYPLAAVEGCDGCSQSASTCPK